MTIATCLRQHRPGWPLKCIDCTIIMLVVFSGKQNNCRVTKKNVDKILVKSSKIDTDTLLGTKCMSSLVENIGLMISKLPNLVSFTYIVNEVPRSTKMPVYRLTPSTIIPSVFFFGLQANVGRVGKSFYA